MYIYKVKITKKFTKNNLDGTIKFIYRTLCNTPHSLRPIALKSVETIRFHKISTPGI